MSTPLWAGIFCLLFFDITDARAGPRPIVAQCPDGQNCCGNNEPCVYTTVTAYLYGGTADTTYTVGSTVVYGSLVGNNTVTTTLPPNATPYTSVITAPAPNQSWTVLYGSPAGYTSTTYLHAPAITGFTSTIENEILIGSPVQQQTVVTTLGQGATPYTSTQTGSGTSPDTIIVGATPSPLSTITSYNYDVTTDYTSTYSDASTTRVVAVSARPTVTQTSTLSSGSVATTSTLVSFFASSNVCAALTMIRSSQLRARRRDQYVTS